MRTPTKQQPKKQIKICPLMSYRDQECTVTQCVEHECMFWITVYTTENVGTRVNGCAHALQPQMSDGRLRV